MNNDGITDLVDYDEDYETSDNTISRSRFVIKVEVFDQTVFPVIQQSIMDYIESNNYIRELNSIRKRQLQALINKLADEISMLDSWIIRFDLCHRFRFYCASDFGQIVPV